MGIRQRGAAFLRDDLSGVVSEMANYFDGRASEAVLRHGRTELDGDRCHEVSGLMTAGEFVE
jgi:hypothetical protein